MHRYVGRDTKRAVERISETRALILPLIKGNTAFTEAEAYTLATLLSEQLLAKGFLR